MVKAAHAAMPFHSKSDKRKMPKPLKPRNPRDKTRDKVMSGLKGLKAPAVSCRQHMGLACLGQGLSY